MVKRSTRPALPITEGVPIRHLGSVDDFERQWQEALLDDGGRWLIFPTSKPVMQTELDELVKANQISSLLSDTGIKSGTILEFGCGAAGMSIWLANRGFQTIGCDISENALRLAGLNAQSHLEENIEGSFQTIGGDGFHLPFADNSFDAVMSFGLLEHFAHDSAAEVVAEAVRTLRSGGLFIADIAHGRFSVRTLGTLTNLIVSFAFHTLTLQWRKLGNLPGIYLDALYENDLGINEWEGLLKGAGLHDVDVRVCRPFPPLAVSGLPERLYVQLLQQCRPFWEWFDSTQPRWGRRWGWLYVAWGTK